MESKPWFQERYGILRTKASQEALHVRQLCPKLLGFSSITFINYYNPAKTNPADISWSPAQVASGPFDEVQELSYLSHTFFLDFAFHTDVPKST